MDQFDRDLKRRAQEEPFPPPDSFVQRLRETCDSLEESPRREPERRQLSHWGGLVRRCRSLPVRSLAQRVRLCG